MAPPLSTLSASVLALASVALAANPTRQFTLTNDCSSDVYFLATSGSAGECSAGCPDGSSCYSTNGYCYWDAPTSSSGEFLVPNGGSITLTFAPLTGNTTWSGNLGFCLDGTCGASESEPYATGYSLTGPYNLAEMTLLYNEVDYYDISNIGGVSVPMSMSPDVANTNSDSIYTCGSPGSPDPSNGLGDSSWDFSPPAVDYNFVTNTGSSCTSSSDCSSGQVCGTVWSDGALSLVCGTLSGYWTENSACGYGVNSADGYFNCEDSVTNGAYTTTIGGLQGCDGTSGSCYQTGADSACCGCPDWTGILGSSLVPAATGSCQNNNSVWDSDVLPTIEWLKAGCPNCYTYPYDDFTSSFTCENLNSDSLNDQNYTITLCPSSSESVQKRAPAFTSPRPTEGKRSTPLQRAAPKPIRRTWTSGRRV